MSSSVDSRVSDKPSTTDRELDECAQTLAMCASACEHCATACLGEPDVSSLASCVRLNRDCAQLCWVAASFVARRSELTIDVCRLCIEACDACEAECAHHDRDHCRACAAACRICSSICRTIAAHGLPA